MSIKLPGTGTARPNPPGGDVAEKLRRSRQRLLDLTLRNRLLNFRPGNPDYRDDLKGHKHVGLKGHIESLWQTLVDDEKQVTTRKETAVVPRTVYFNKGYSITRKMQ